VCIKQENDAIITCCIANGVYFRLLFDKYPFLCHKANNYSVAWIRQYLALLCSGNRQNKKLKEDQRSKQHTDNDDEFYSQHALREDMAVVDMLEVCPYAPFPSARRRSGLATIIEGESVSDYDNVGMINGECLVDVMAMSTNPLRREASNHKVVGVSFLDYMIKSLACG
jgi:hypothetical protein